MALERRPGTGGIVEILDRVLDKGVVIDASVRVAVAGIELIGLDARVVVASFDTYLRHADAIASMGLAAAPDVFDPDRRPSSGEQLTSGFPVADALTEGYTEP